jgi:hypothetical protein
MRLAYDCEQEDSMRDSFQAIFLSALLAGCATAPLGPSDAALQALEPARLDELYRHPDADFTRWNTLYVEPLHVTYAHALRSEPRFRKPEDFQLDDRDQARLRSQVIKALETAWGDTWTLVDAPGPGTLVLQLELSDFYLYAPIRDDYPGVARSYTRESSRFLLHARLLSPEGELLLESRDRRVTGDRGSGPFTRFSGVFYWSDVYRDFQRWAQLLQPALIDS